MKRVLSYVPVDDNLSLKREYIDLDILYMNEEEIEAAIREYFGGAQLCILYLEKNGCSFELYFPWKSDAPRSFACILNGEIFSWMHGRFFAFEMTSEFQRRTVRTKEARDALDCALNENREQAKKVL